MPTVNYSIASSADDVSNSPVLGGFTPDALIQGSFSGSNYAGVRFMGVAVPQGATITSATLTLIGGGAVGGANGTSLGVWKGVAADNAPAWTTTGPNTGSRTTASVTVLGAAQDASAVHTVTSIVQEIINRSGWASGNALAFAGDPTGATHVAGYYDYLDDSSKVATLSITYTAGGGSGTGTVSATLGSLASSGTGKLAIRGTATPTLATLTGTRTGKLALRATSSATLGALTSTTTGRLVLSGTASKTLDPLTAAGTGALQGTGTGSAAVTLDSLSANGVGALAVAGASSPTLGAVTSSATGSLRVAGTSSAQLDALNSTAAGALRISGSGAATLAPLTLYVAGEDPGYGSGNLEITGALDVGLDDLTLSASGLLAELEERQGSLSAALDGLTAGGSGSLRLAASATISLDGLTMLAMGRLIVPSPPPPSRISHTALRLPVTTSTARRTTRASRRAA